MPSLVQTRVVAGTIFKSVLFNTRFIVPIAETARKMVDRAIDEYHLSDLGEEPTTIAGDNQLIECSPSHAMKPSRIWP